MKLLQEIIGIKNISDQAIAEYLNTLIRDGKIKVRSGSYAFVVIPTDASIDYVYKVWTHDDGWWEYLEYVGDHPNDPHLLKIKSRIKKIKFTFKRPKDFDTSLFIVKVEKLKELEEGSEEYDQVKGLMNYFRYNDVNKLTTSDIPDIQARVMREESVKPPPASFVQSVIDVLQSATISYTDFHMGNVMMRDDKTLVVTDPYYVPEGFGANVKISASDLLHGRFYGKYDSQQGSKSSL